MPQCYNKAGFGIRQIECDNAFRAIFEQVADKMDVYMNYTNPQDHQSRAERNNRTIKENARVILHRTGYQVIPRTMI